MLSSLFQQEVQFHPYDALLFGRDLADDVQDILPVPASVSFFFHDPDLADTTFLSHQQAILTTGRKETDPFTADGMLVIPLPSENRSGVDIVVTDIDQGLLDKMDPDWLLELQNDILARFALTRKRFIEPATGLYNQRALYNVMSGPSCWKSLFLIATVSRKLTVAGSAQKVVRLASFFEVIVHNPLFYFGQGIFGSISRTCERREALDFAHRVIGRLRREKLQRVHVGFTCLDGDQPPEESLGRCWQALNTAERRGPYSLCDAAALDSLHRHPFALPRLSVVRRLQRQWQGMEQFGLAVFSRPEKDSEAITDLQAQLPEDVWSIEIFPDQLLVLLPENSSRQTANRVKAMADQFAAAGSPAAAGYSHWPSAAASKVDCIRNCRKALVHGSFYGPDAVVCFDYLSLNVSGDLYFDEGDYKQAIREYRRGLELEPGDINLLNSLGVALAEINRPVQAIACFSEVLALQPDNHMALVNKGMSCRLVGRDVEAVACFEQALYHGDEKNRPSLELCLQLSRLYCSNHKYGSAVELLKQWQEGQGAPEEFMFFKMLGEACMGAELNRDAIKALQRSLQLHPRNADSLSMLGLLYVKEGEGAELGLSLCDRAITMDETEAAHWYRRAAALVHLAGYEEALAAVRTALQLNKNHVPAVLLRGRIYEALGWTARAGQSYQRVIRMKESRPEEKQQAQVRLKETAD